MKQNIITKTALLLSFMWTPVAPGCGGPANVASVTGTVTLDGQPLADATVTFVPVEASGTLSRGTTDAVGRYQLVYDSSYNGAAIGEYTVSISTFSSGLPDADPPQPKIPEKVPAKYNLNSELKAAVTGGRNELDFALDGDGKIIQPDSKEAEQNTGLLRY